MTSQELESGKHTNFIKSNIYLEQVESEEDDDEESHDDSFELIKRDMPESFVGSRASQKVILNQRYSQT